MIKNFFKIAFRSILKNKTYSLLNILGLAIGITCASLIFMWVEDEVSFDNSFLKKDLVYYVPTNQNYDGQWRTFNSTPGPLAPTLKAEISGVVNAARVRRQELLFSLDEKAIDEKGIYADQSFFDIFSLQFLQGSAKTAFTDVNSIVVTEKIAHQFFGDEKNIVGKYLKLNNQDNYKISGVVKDLPQNVTLKFDWIADFVPYAKGKEWMNEWGSNSLDTYVELSPKANVASVNKVIKGLIKEKTGETGTQAFLFSMKDWHLRDQFVDGKQVGGKITYVKMFTGIAWVILLIACINFMNLATARSEKRAKEVSVKKVLGAEKKRLIFQFIIEALIMSAIAVLLAVLIIILILPSFNAIVEKELAIGYDNPSHIITLLIITILCGLLAGAYPAFYLSSFNAVSVLKGVKSGEGSAAFIRKSLVIIQFSVSVILIIGTVIVYQQIQHVKDRNLGYNKDHLMTMKVRGVMGKKFKLIKQDLLNTGLIENVALNSFETLSIGNNSIGATWQGKDESKDILISNRFISPEFISTTEMKIMQGRDFSVDSPADSTNVIITNSLAKIMSAGSPIGKTISYGDRTWNVVGVVKDFLYGNMYGQSDPVIFFCLPNENPKYMFIRTKENASINNVITQMQLVMKKDNPAFPFEYSFVDDEYNAKFKSEMLIGKLSQIFAVLAIIISCLGLFGLAAYTAERRVKEIGVRKVLGASVSGITILLSKDFLKLVALSCIIAFPIAWWVMNNWLQGYQYRISISWWVFLFAALISILVAIMTVSFQAIKAALANPVKSLRTE